MANSKAVVIGAGIGGLAAAIRLSMKGYHVTVIDKNNKAGGKLTDFSLGSYRFDFGPSLFTMPQYVEELFTLCGRDAKDYFEYESMDEACRYFYPDGTAFVAPTDAHQFAKAASKTFDVPEASINKYFDYNERIFNKAGRIFLTKSMYKIGTFLNLDALNSVAQSYVIELFRSMNSANVKSLKNAKLVQLFNRYATYNGSSPYKAPAILNSVSILEHLYGTYFPKGGMYNITQAIYNLALEQGVTFKFNELVTQIEYDTSVKSVVTDTATYQADIVISNMDVSFTYEKLLSNKELPYLQRNHEKSSSAVIFYWGVKKVFSQLGLHNIFFSDEYDVEFKTIFEDKSIGSDPTVYINISSIHNPDDAPPNGSNWFVMINVPGDFGQDWTSKVKHLKDDVLNKLSNHLGENIASLIEEEYIVDPTIIEQKTLSHKGSLYGSSSNNWIDAFLRHPNFSSKIKGLYFVGGSVHPGGGIPLCLLSAKIATELIDNG